MGILDWLLFPEKAEKEQSEKYFAASQWRLMAWRFRKHRVALWAAAVLVFLYLVALLCEFVAPYSPHQRDRRLVLAPPQKLHWVTSDGFHLRPFVYALKGKRNPDTFQMEYVEDRTKPLPVRFFVRGEKYRLWGLIPTDLHLLGVGEGGYIHLLGTDNLGRDLFSRIVYGSRISLSIGLVGVGVSFLLGILIGGISGYYGGWVDHGIQRLIEILRSIPAIPLWLALSVALPPHWSGLKVYFGITLVLSFLGWTGLARVVRGKILSLREEDYAVAALVAGSSEMRIIVRHLIPAFLSHIIVSVTLSIPGMILGETALSFLGLGLRPPTVSWGVLLQGAQNVDAVARHPWLLTPVFAVIITVLAFNFVGDGLRDAADPYAK